MTIINISEDDMNFSITRQGGQYQFWHTDCRKSKHGGIMSTPDRGENDIVKFTCISCEMAGRVTMPRIITGSGTLEVISG